MSPPAHVASRSAKTLVLSVALALLLLPLPSYAGQWRFSVTDGSGTASASAASTISSTWGAANYPAPGSTGLAVNFGSQGNAGNRAVSSAAQLTLTVTIQWLPATGKTMTTDPPPPTLNLRETANATGSLTEVNAFTSPGTSVTSAADDDLGDSQVPSQTFNGSPGYYSFSNLYVSAGSHLVTKDASSGTIVLPRSLSASVSAPIGSDIALSTYSQLSYSVQLDSRSVTISSSIDPSYHKDTTTGKPAQNLPASDGTMTADSVKLGGIPGAAITYIAHPLGGWAANSSYHWYSAMTSNSGGGIFTLPSDPPYGFDVPYSSVFNFDTPEHINLHCTSASDGANATANYYVNWHDDIENWITVIDVKQYGPMTRVTPIYHPLNNEAHYSYEVTNSVKVSQKATGEGSLGTDKIGAKFGVEIGAEFESATKVTVEFSLVANKANWVDRQAFWRHREGTVDTYGFQGYEGLLHWTLDSAYNPSNPLIDYGDFQRASTTDPPN